MQWFCLFSEECSHNALLWKITVSDDIIMNHRFVVIERNRVMRSRNDDPIKIECERARPFTIIRLYIMSRFRRLGEMFNF